MKLRSLFLILLFLFPMLSTAQNDSLRIGRVLDAGTGEALAKAKVTILPSRKVLYSDDEGRFTLKINSNNQRLVVSRLGYSSQTLPLNRLDQDIMVFLVPDPVSLPTEVISAERIVLAFKEKKKHVYDFDFLGEDLLLLIKEKGKKEPVLALVDGDGEILYRHAGLPERGGAIYRDAFGKRHVLSRNFAFQVTDDGEELLVYQDSLKHFDTWVRPCIGKVGDFLYFEKNVNDYLKAFFYYDRALKEYSPFAYVSGDKELAEIMDERIYNEKKLNTAATDPIRAAFQESLDKAYAEHVIYPPLHASLRILRGKVRIFDHSAGRILTFNADGSPSLEPVFFDYHSQKGWAKKVISDEEQEQAYTWFLKNGVPRLYRINLNTGKLEGGWDLEKRFVDKIRIRDGWAYFLYRDEFGYTDTRRLYKVRLN